MVLADHDEHDGEFVALVQVSQIARPTAEPAVIGLALSLHDDKERPVALSVDA